MFCKGCGKGVDTSATICPHCGRNVDALSGGTGFWDLLKESPGYQAPPGSRAQEGRSPIGDAKPEPGDIAPIEPPDTPDEIPRMAHDSDITKQRSGPTKRRDVSPHRVSPFVIGIGATACVLVVAVALILSQCSNAGEGGGVSDEVQSASSAASEWGDAHGEASEEGQGSNQGDSAENGGSASEGNRESRGQGNPFPGNQDAADNDSREASRFESTQSTQDQTSEQQQEEGTKNGQ